MAESADRKGQASLSPEQTFVIQLRSGADVRRRLLSGRVEHVMSGCSEAFTSLAGLLEFLGRYAKTDETCRSGEVAKDDEGRDGE
jgi:hypothetical protein